MANLNSVLNDRISRVARKQIKSETGTSRRHTVQHRRDLAALKRQVADLQRRLAFVETQAKKTISAEPSPALAEGARFSARSVKAQRRRLGLSAEHFGRLVGVSGPTIYLWENGTRPRKEQLAKFVAVRGLGRREASRRLEMLGVSTNGQHRGTYPQTAEEFVISLIKSRKAKTSAQINAAWKKSGRRGAADNTLSRMVKFRTLKRMKLKKERGSRYAVA